MIDRILSFNKPLIISTGLLNILQIEKLYNYIKKKKYSNELVLMHCVSSYPTSYKDVNLSAIQYMIKKFKNCLIGYSDHTIGIECCVYASCLGAKVIEKHFTLDKNFSDFRDHQISADPQEMISLVKKIRSIKTILGNEKKFVTKNELLNIRNLRRSICASRDLKKGKILNSSDFEYLRPQLGMSADKYHQLIGKKISNSNKNNPKMRGENNGNSKLIKNDVINIRKFYELNSNQGHTKTIKQIMKLYNMGYTAIDSIIKYKTWRV
jgi:sialic acid synthase SpsE